MESPVVMLLIGESGVGKTELTKRMAAEMQGRMLILEPSLQYRREHEGKREPFNKTIPWNEIDCVALDEVETWDAPSFAQALNTMQDDAARLGKKILLILQNASQLVSGGITLKSTPAMLTLKGQCNEARFEYMGKVLRYPELAT